jgi:hypothetical protein
MPLTKVQAGLLEATGTADSTTFLRGDGAWSTPVASALSTASGSAPSYSARAWVNFNGTGTVAIRASGNVSSITDNGTGDYTVNFSTAMSDANYSAAALPNDNTVGTNLIIACENQTRTKSASQYHLYTAYGGNGVNKALYDINTVNVSVFR